MHREREPHTLRKALLCFLFPFYVFETCQNILNIQSSPDCGMKQSYVMCQNPVQSTLLGLALEVEEFGVSTIRRFGESLTSELI